MSVLSASCPSCAGPLEFRSGSTVVIICPFCRSAVARTDRALEDLGKVSDIVQSESPLRLGLKGSYKGNSFEITGRSQLKHSMGGSWDEWYATFSNGWVGWLAEAQGKFYLTFYRPTPPDQPLPDISRLQVDESVELGDGLSFVVAEKGTATAAAAEGELPFQFVPGEQSDYADLVGKNNSFATIDYGISPPWVFVGEQVSLADIGLSAARPADREKRKVAVGKMPCPNCGGPLELSVPDKTERVACPFCMSLLDVDQGNLKYLKSLRRLPADPQFALEIGAEGTFKDVKFKVIGAMVRSVRIDGIKYFWHEYLLYNAMVGFRWLVCSDDHWNFVEPVNPAEVETNKIDGAGGVATYDGRRLKIFQHANADVEFVKGEFYWRVEQGERVEATDYVKAPLMLSRERTGNEVNWSAGIYLTRQEVEDAFGISGLKKPSNVAPNQPFTGGFYYTWGLIPILLLFIIAIFMLPFTGFSSSVLSETITLQPGRQSTVPGAAPTESAPQILFSSPFELKANRNVRVSASAPVSNSAVDLEIDLINDKNVVIESLVIPVSYYSGVEGGESWSEGSRDNDATISSVPAGKYAMRISGTTFAVREPISVNLKVEQNVSRGVNFICSLILLAIFPILGVIRKLSFEGSRWSESMFAPVSDD